MADDRTSHAHRDELSGLLPGRQHAALRIHAKADDARYALARIAERAGRGRDAARAYQQVIDRAAGGIYGQMARLGLAEAQARAGQYDQAINVFKELAQRKDGPLPIDGILIQLGRTYRDVLGRANQQLAQAADEVIFMVAGLPMRVK